MKFKATIYSMSLLFIVTLLLTLFFQEKYKFLPISSNDGLCENLPFMNNTLKVETRVNDLLGRMTIKEKIGQMILVEKNSIKNPDDISEYRIGALLSGGGGNPDDNSPEGWLRMIEGFQNISKKTRLCIPLIYGADANHGHSNIPSATIFPHYIGLAASRDPEIVRQIAKVTADEIRATGVNWVFSPNLDIAGDMRWGRVYETFGSDPELAGILGTAYIEGLQSKVDGTMIIATAKHFVGNGASQWGSSINKNYHIDQGNTMISYDDLREIYLKPFRRAIEANVKSVMIGLNRWNDEKIVFNKHLISDVLKTELGFRGFVVSDWYGIFAEEKDRYKTLVKSINAGVDMIMLPYDYKFFSESLQYALKNKEIDEVRINDAVSRILKVKFEIGLFGNNSKIGNLKDVGSESHREIARNAVRKSLILLKNENVLPISKNTSRILVGGSAADNLGRQSGGWTVQWQGIDGNGISGTTILKGIKNAVSGTTKVQYNLKGEFSKQNELAEVGIAIIGEKPYAEGWGDSGNLTLSPEDLETVTNLKKYSKKIIVIIISGRPLDISKYSRDWDSIIAAWLPGSEGEGVSDLIFGDYPFTGKLPVKWDI